MFSDLDSIIFPDSCEVIKTTSQQYIYPIFKCGRSSLTMTAKEKGWGFVLPDSITNITEPINVFVREPWERFYSGVNTYVQHLEREQPGLDQWTVLFFVNKYLFLNRHYCPQFSWLLNLARFSNTNTLITLRGMNELSMFTDLNSDAEVLPPSDEFRVNFDSFVWDNISLYLFIDRMIVENIGQTLTIQELFDRIKNKHPEQYSAVFKKTMDLVNVLPKT